MIREPGDLPRSPVVPRVRGSARAELSSALDDPSGRAFGRKGSTVERRLVPRRTSRSRLGIATAGIALVAASLVALSAASGGAVRAAAFPITIGGANGPITLSAAPSRIISLSPTATDMLFSIGAGRQVVAVDSDSTLPASAPRTSLSGLTPNLEAIAKYRPDLVVISYNPNGFAAALGRLHIPVLLEDAATSLKDTYAQLSVLGRATGHTGSAQSLIASMRRQLASIVAAAPHVSPPLTYYYELDQTYYSVTSNTFVGSLLSMLGLKDIADAASGAASGYPQLSAEYILKSNPQLIILADTVCCGQSAATVAKRPGWSKLLAVQHGAVLGLNDTVASEWGPTVVTLERDVEQELHELATRHG